MDRADKEALFRDRISQDDVEIPGVGTVRVRGLSRHEMLVAQREQSKGVAAYEKLMLHYGMVDPALSEDEVVRWQKASPAGELEPVTHRIVELSGVGPGAAKGAYKSVRGDTGAGVRVLPGGETADDGGAPTSGNVV